MRGTLIGIVKILLPLALGIWLVVHFYRQLDPGQREELFIAFGQANWWWLAISVVLGWCSHLSRAWRWRYLLEHMDHRVGYWNAYNATLTGYFMNMLLPRAGEASRAVMLYRAEGVPFERGFGTILAERAVDMVMLLSIAAVTVALQWDKLDVFEERITAFRAEQVTTDGGTAASTNWFAWITALVITILIAAAYFIWTRPMLRARIMDGVRGFVAGMRSVLETRHKLAFLFHTCLIWGLYVAMFWIGFYALPSTAEVPAAGIMAGFIAGAIGIVLVQGGIGVYPAFVGLIVSIYLPLPEGGGMIRPDALAMGWLLWLAQTVMITLLGGVSLFLISHAPPHRNAATLPQKEPAL